MLWLCDGVVVVVDEEALRKPGRVDSIKPSVGLSLGGSTAPCLILASTGLGSGRGGDA